MDPLIGIKPTFTGGEFSPSLYSRVDLTKYSNGARRLRNFIVHPHGGISNRPGQKYIATGKIPGKKIRFIPFEFSTEQTYVLEFGHYYCRIYANGGQIVGEEGWDSFTKLMAHCDGSDGGTTFTDEIGKTITNTANYDAYTKVCSHFDGSDAAQAYTDPIAGAWTFQGTAQLDTAQKKFGTASILFDGDSDYVTLPDSANIYFGTGNFTIDCWIRVSAFGGAVTPIMGQYQDANNFWILYLGAEGGSSYSVLFKNRVGGVDTVSIAPVGTFVTNTWYHIALVRNGNTFTVYQNGTSLGSTIDADEISDFSGLLSLGAVTNETTTYYLNGWIDEVRISKGIARWTSNFTVPTYPYGQVVTSTSQYKFGTAGAYFDGSGSRLTLADHADWNFADDDFTIDFWFKPENLTAASPFIGQYDDSTHMWELRLDTTNGTKLSFLYYNGAGTNWTFEATHGMSAGSWYHIALVRSGNTWTWYVDGVSIGSTTDSSTMPNLASVLYIGNTPNNDASVSGSIDELRVSKGVARWVTTFFVPTSAYAEEFLPVEVETPYSEDDLANIGYTQSADVLYLAHPDYYPRQLERLSATSWQLVAYDFRNGPFQKANTDETKTIAASALTGDDKTLTAAGFTFDDGLVGALFKLRHYIEGQAVSSAITGTGATSSIKCGGTWRLITHGTWTGKIRIEKSTDGGSTWTMLREFSSADDFNANTYGTEELTGDEDPFLVRINCTAYTSGTCNVNLTTDPFYQEGVAKITAVAEGGVTATVDIKRDIGSTSATIDWAEGSWSDYRGWPAVVEFHPEDRLMFGNNYNEPQTYWLTKNADYTNFGRSSPLVDSDGISSPLPSRKVNGINGLIPLTEMVALTLSNEVSIRSSSGPLTPTTAYNKIHGWEGSYGIRPVLIGNRAIYIQSTGSIVRDLGFDLYQDSFVGNDLSVFSEHLFKGHTIVDMAYQQNPDRILWAVRDDGILLSMTYMREQEVVAWSWHDTNDGDDLYESVCCIRGDGYDEVWVAVNRGGTRYIERMVKRMESTALEDQFFVDCGYTYDGEATTTITDLDHLEGKTVAILADGVVQDQQVVSGGQITLEEAASVVQVGLPYKSDLETLNVEANMQDGSLQGRQIKIPRVVIRFLNSKGGYIGPNENKLFPLNFDQKLNYDPDTLFSDDHPHTLGGGYTDGGRIFFRQSDPLPVTITALIPTFVPGGMSQVR